MSADVSPVPGSPGPGRLAALDAVRAIGSIAVVVFHVGFNTGVNFHGTWQGLVSRLDSGVAVFFVLSGFLLFRPFAHALATGRERPGVSRFLWRRAVRILPAYWLVVTVCLLAIPSNRDTSALNWVKHLTLTQIYGQAQLGHGLGQMWSLCTEFAFYLVLPLLALVALGRRWQPVRTVVTVAVLCVGLNGAWFASWVLGYVRPFPASMQLPSHLLWFGAGITLATIHVALATGTGPARWRLLDDVANAPFACWAVAVGVLGVASTPLVGPRDLAPQSNVAFFTKAVLYAVIAALVLIPVAFGRDNAVKRAFSTTPARWLGAVSYGLFLWHPFVLELIYGVYGYPFFTGQLVTILTLTLAGGLFLAALSYYTVERPLQRWAARPRVRRSRTTIESHSTVAAANATT
jgi:peptidoglycan/LPS O-acetylase OafA/YrhL